VGSDPTYSPRQDAVHEQRVVERRGEHVVVRALRQRQHAEHRLAGAGMFHERAEQRVELLADLGGRSLKLRADAWSPLDVIGHL